MPAYAHPRLSRGCGASAGHPARLRERPTTSSASSPPGPCQLTHTHDSVVGVEHQPGIPPGCGNAQSGRRWRSSGRCRGGLSCSVRRSYPCPGSRRMPASAARMANRCRHRVSRCHEGIRERPASRVRIPPTRHGTAHACFQSALSALHGRLRLDFGRFRRFSAASGRSLQNAAVFSPGRSGLRIRPIVAE